MGKTHPPLNKGKKPAAADRKGYEARGNAPEQQFADFPPESSGLCTETLAALPLDAPGESAAFAKARMEHDKFGNRIVRVMFTASCKKTEQIQVTEKAAGDNLYAAFRIARACYVKLEAGLANDALDSLRPAEEQDGDRSKKDVSKSTDQLKRKHEPEDADANLEETSFAEQLAELEGERPEEGHLGQGADDSRHFGGATIADQRVSRSEVQLNLN
jgi:hypothetical protein